MERSYQDPSLRTSAGARFKVYSASGSRYPPLTMARRMRSRASFIAVSGKPTMVMTVRSAARKSASVSTAYPSMPFKPTAQTFATIIFPFVRHKMQLLILYDTI